MCTQFLNAVLFVTLGFAVRFQTKTESSKLIVRVGGGAGKVPKRSWGASTTVSVRDLWEHASVGKATGKYTSAPIVPHGSMFFKLTPN